MTARTAARLAVELARALATMTMIEAGLRTGDLPATCRRLRLRCDLASVTPPAAEPAVLPRSTRTPVLACALVVSRWPAGDTCLRRCLLVGRRLRGLDPVLRIGVRREPDGRFSAHSWLEIGGRPLDPVASRYAALGSANGGRA
ncbi:lasso peptide biosynthesis B2 protein [Qaidamihabitans albus]|uniref:lasso peptide biosynthesis B2 protein n=1 Tax=Qaidamihabitans albus TaxID=2795733 RepID=UPI001F2A3BF2|nr:lasso peptide biosynthesis B2 protein [Qaidamihabitans albus]